MSENWELDREDILYGKKKPTAGLHRDSTDQVEWGEGPSLSSQKSTEQGATVKSELSGHFL